MTERELRGATGTTRTARSAGTCASAGEGRPASTRPYVRRPRPDRPWTVAGGRAGPESAELPRRSRAPGDRGRAGAQPARATRSACRSRPRGRSRPTGRGRRRIGSTPRRAADAPAAPRRGAEPARRRPRSPRTGRGRSRIRRPGATCDRGRPRAPPRRRPRRWTDPGAVAAQEAQRARSSVDGLAPTCPRPGCCARPSARRSPAGGARSTCSPGGWSTPGRARPTRAAASSPCGSTSRCSAATRSRC